MTSIFYSGKIYSFALLFIFLFLSFNGKGQILSYTNDTTGALASVAVNATGTPLIRVNGATLPAASCGTGFSTASFSLATTYSTALPAVEVSVSPNTGYMLNVTGFSIDLRRSASGPATVRLAYSTDGGATWTDQGINQAPNNAGCGSTITATWSSVLSVTAPSYLKFRAYGFSAGSTGGTLQVLNLVINGTVTATTVCGVASGLTSSGITSASATLTWASVTGAVSYNIRYRPTGSTTWTTTTSPTNSIALSGLIAATVYEYQVQTVCASGTSVYTSSANFTTLSITTSGSTGKIAIYFNTPVNNTVSTGVNAVYLANHMADTLVAYINRARYTIDIAQYDYNQSSGFVNIATAINNAYTRGVRVRWIYDGSQSNTGLALLNSGIPTLGSPTTSAYGIMHDKFVIIDAHSSNATDPVVSTGSEDWGVTQFNYDNNNILFIQDSALAQAYTNEFNMMWGDTGIAPNTTLSKFGPYKTDLGAHLFNIGGKPIELYFSPSDHTDSHIQSSINSANTDLYFGVYTFTESTDANAIVARHTAGVYTLGIVDQYSIGSSAYTILSAGIGSYMKTYASSSLIYHNKMVIIDPSNTCSDPQVLTGSHNWTVSADTKNDENTLIIHSDTIANIYYQSFYANYTALGGTVTPIAPCVAGTCSASTLLPATAITNTSAIINWTNVTGATGYRVEYRMAGATIWTTVMTSVNSLTVTGLIPSSSYQFQVQTICSSTDSSSFGTMGTFSTISTSSTAVANIELLDQFSVFPNPVAKYVTIGYHLKNAGNVTIGLYDMLGREITPVVHHEQQTAGDYSFSSEIKTSGVYFIKVEIDGQTMIRKVIKL